MSLNLHGLAAAVVRESASPDPEAMVAEFVAQIDPADYREALAMLARSFIREAIRHRRDTTNGGAPANGSGKVAAARDAWKRLLDTPEFLPSTGQWVFLRDASRDQVLEMAGVRMEKSRELAAAAKRYRKLADEMERTGAASVADLDQNALRTLLAPAAAAKAVQAA